MSKFTVICDDCYVLLDDKRALGQYFSKFSCRDLQILCTENDENRLGISLSNINSKSRPDHGYCHTFALFFVYEFESFTN